MSDRTGDTPEPVTPAEQRADAEAPDAVTATAEPAQRPLPAFENRGMTDTEKAAWWSFVIGLVVFFIALLTFSNETNNGGDVATPLAFMSVGEWIMTVSIIPALLLTGIRSLLPDRRL